MDYLHVFGHVSLSIT